MGEVFAVAALLAPIVTKLTDAVRNAVAIPKSASNLLAFAIGIVLALLVEVDVSGIPGGASVLGLRVVVGLAAGAGGSLVHEAADAVGSHAKKKRAEANAIDEGKLAPTTATVTVSTSPTASRKPKKSS